MLSKVQGPRYPRRERTSSKDAQAPRSLRSPPSSALFAKTGRGLRQGGGAPADLWREAQPAQFLHCRLDIQLHRRGRGRAGDGWTRGLGLGPVGVQRTRACRTCQDLPDLPGPKEPGLG